ncbi:MAG: hypothetical protein KJZ86_08715 [Caldilineaceae bacterium]|nr:hypothetical protein [Caldilineaceae bacterium]
MQKLEVRVLGTPQVHLNGAPVRFRLRKSLALFIYLTVTRQPHSRDKLATLLWPGYDQSTTRAYLRKALSLLQQDLPGDWLKIDRHQLALADCHNFWLDAAEYAALANGGGKGSLDRLEHAAALYTGDFLDGFSLPDAEGFEEWRLHEAESLRGRLMGVLKEVVDGLASQGEASRALAYARQRVELDAYDEAAHVALMNLYAANGQSGPAIRQYETLVRLLKDELGVLPAAETTATWREIVENGRRNNVQNVPLPAAVQTDIPSGPPSNLPHLPASFVGREEELGLIAARLADPACRLLTLAGPGGMGKSRLAIEAGTRLLADSPALFPDGVWFVPLVAAETRDGLVSQLADTFQLPFARMGDPFPELLKRLEQKRLLIVLDNFEQLLAHAPLLSQLLTVAGGVKLLVTSRERLNLPEEWLIHLHGLAVPPDLSGTPADFSRVPDVSMGAPDRSPPAPALTLFTQRLRQLQLDFAPTGEEGRWAGEVCRMVGGMPLALELAAAWGDVLSCREIVQQLEISLGILRSESLSLPERHRSMAAVLASAWQRLSGEEQQVMARLSLFRGGFTREAAAAVTGASLLLLQGLIHRSLLRRTGEGRYEMQELIRQYAGERLARQPERHAAAQAAHAGYFAAFIQAREKELTTNPSPALLDEVAADIENVRVAWRYALERDEMELLLQMVVGLAKFRHNRAEWSGVVDTAYLMAASHCEETWGKVLATRSGEDALKAQLVWGLILRESGTAQRRAGRTAHYVALIKRAIQRLHPISERWPGHLAVAYLERSLCTSLAGETIDPFEMVDIAIHWAEKAESPRELCSILSEKGVKLINAGRLAEGIADCQRAVSLADEANVIDVKIGALSRLGIAAHRLGDYTQAYTALQSANELKSRVNNAFIEWSVSVARINLLRDMGKLQEAALGVADLERYVRQPNVSVSNYWLIELPILQAMVFWDEGELEQALSLLEVGLEKQVALGHQGGGEADVRLFLAWVVSRKGDLRRGIDEARRSLAAYAKLQHTPQQAEALALLSQLHTLAGSETPTAIRQSIDLALRLSQSAGTVPVTLEALYSLALLHSRGDPEEQAQAIRLLALIDKHPSARWETRQRASQLSMTLRAGMPLARFASLREQGFGLRLEDAVTAAIGEGVKVGALVEMG